MIGHLSGTLRRRAMPLVIVEAGGVGYELTVSLATLEQLPPEGRPVALEVLTLWRNESLQLFGFTTPEEKALFGILTAVPGIGPRLGMALLSSLSVGELVSAVHQERASTLQAVPGIGKKTAERLILELRDKLKDWRGGAPGAAGTAGGGPAGALERDAAGALENLGYKPAEIQAALARVPVSGEGEGLAALVRAALRELGARP
ncbi:MAG: Holliday junction branch migration protein RuvA [Acidobacteria bacterium]|nr:Holliday junction branch migration protein RuvA [Acidobacteriota bacterium]